VSPYFTNKLKLAHVLENENRKCFLQSRWVLTFVFVLWNISGRASWEKEGRSMKHMNLCYNITSLVGNVLFDFDKSPLVKETLNLWSIFSVWQHPCFVLFYFLNLKQLLVSFFLLIWMDNTHKWLNPSWDTVGHDTSLKYKKIKIIYLFCQNLNNFVMGLAFGGSKPSKEWWAESSSQLYLVD